MASAREAINKSIYLKDTIGDMGEPGKEDFQISEASLASPNFLSNH